MRQLVLQHLQGRAGPSRRCRRATARRSQRALAKNPDDRFPTCMEFIQSLIAAADRQSRGDAVPPAPPPPSVRRRHFPGPTRSFNRVQPPANEEQTRDARGQRPPAACGRKATPRPSDEADPSERPNVLAAAAHGHWSSRSPRRPEFDPRTDHAIAHRGESYRQHTSRSRWRIRLQAASCSRRWWWGWASWACRRWLRMRRSLSHAVRPRRRVAARPPAGIDTDPESIQAAGQGESQAVLRAHEVVLARLHRPSHYLQQRDRDGESGAPIRG